MRGTMTGSGTETDPYIIEDVYDFCAITSGADDTYYKLEENVDFNYHDTYRFGISKTIVNAPHAIVNLNNHYVANVVLESETNSGVVFTFKSISNGKIINHYVSDNKVGSSIYECEFSNVAVFVYLQEANFRGGFISLATTNKFTGSTIAIAGLVSTSLRLDLGSDMEYCHVHFSDLIVSDTRISNYQYSPITLNNFTKVYFTGKITSTLTNATSQPGICVMGNSSSIVKNCIWLADFYIPDLNQTARLLGSAHASSLSSVVNKDKIHVILHSEPIKTNYTKWLTDDECRRASSISAAGVPVVNITNTPEEVTE